MGKVKKIYSATVTGVTHECRGLTRIDGKTTFLEGGLPEEEVQFHYTRRYGSYDEGRVTDISKAHPWRIIPKCQHFGHCGGCQLQHIPQAAQLDFKQRTLIELLHHHSIIPREINPPLHGRAWNYRGKARLSVKFLEKKNTVLIGFREKNSHFVTAMKNCEVLKEPFNTIITPLSELFLQLKIRDKIPQVEIATTEEESAIILRHLVELPSEDVHKLREFCDNYLLKLYLQPGGIDSIYLDWPKQCDDTLCYHLPEFNLKLRFYPHQFVQIHSEVNQKMIHQAMNWLNPHKKDCILDLFCGIGNFTLPLAQSAKEVIGVEGNLSAVKQGLANARYNALNNVQFYETNLTQPLSQPWSKKTYTKILLDPPRTGAFEIIPWIAHTNASAVLYISCNITTFIRDAGILLKKGYELDKISLIDMFPQTQHVEIMALFIKR